MKYISKLFFALLLITAFGACKKVAELPFYKNGTPVALTSSVNTVSTAPSDSAKTVLQLSWTDPKYSESPSLYKYVIEIDSTGRNFAKEYKLVTNGVLDASFTGKQFNDIMASIGVVAGTAASVDIRVTSSYGNNNEAYQSNVLTIKVTPYIVPITVTSSTAGPLILQIPNAANSVVVLNWNATSYGNLPFTYAVQLDTVGGNFAKPQVFAVNGAVTKDIKTSELNTAVLAAGASVGVEKEMEMRVVAFQGTNTVPSVISNVIKLKVTPYSPVVYLWVPGDYQTPPNWSPGTAPQLGADPGQNDYEGYINVPSGGSFEFKITPQPNWDNAFGDGGPGKLSSSGGNLNWPNGGGYYYVKANPVALTWSAVITNWGIIGDATPGGWDNSTPMTYDPTTKLWTISSVTLAAKSIKFRANNGWDINLGGSLSQLSYGGDNIAVSQAGNYKIVLDLSHPLRYTATITKL